MLMMASNLYTFYRELITAYYLPIEHHDGITEALHSPSDGQIGVNEVDIEAT